MSEIAIVVVGIVAILCVLVVFAFVARPREFRRHAPRAAIPRRPDGTVVGRPTRATPSPYKGAATDFRRPGAQPTGVPEQRGDRS